MIMSRSSSQFFDKNQKKEKLSQEKKVIRTDWTFDDISQLIHQPFNDLLFQAHSIHRHYFDPNSIQTSSLMSIKTGSCSEDCAYCPQSAHYNTGLSKEQLVTLDKVIASAKQAKQSGASRFCMGAAWKSPTKKGFPIVLAMVQAVKALGLETCMTLGQLTQEQASQLKSVGLDYYNHNIDTSKNYYSTIISTRTFDERLATLESVRNAGINVCSGGILGMGETHNDRLHFLLSLANLPEHPQSVPINQLIPIKGTPLENAAPISSFDFIRMVALARIMMPKTYIRLSAGRETMLDEMQALCFFAGANSLFYGDKLLTTSNPNITKDQALFSTLGLSIQPIKSSKEPILSEIEPSKSNAYSKNTPFIHEKPLYKNAALN
jgi:biotin synthase